MTSWRQAVLLVSGLGLSYLGNWIYFVAINLTVLDLSGGSAAAVAVLFALRPAALLLTNFWSGSIVDRADPRRLMIASDLVRGALMAAIPFVSTLWGIYALVFLIGLAGSFFGPSQQVYIVKLIPGQERARFNSILGMSSSGAFLLGPAVSGLFIPLWGADFSIFFNAATFFACAGMIARLPSVGEGAAGAPAAPKEAEADRGEPAAGAAERSPHGSNSADEPSLPSGSALAAPGKVRLPRLRAWAADWREVGRFARSAKPFLLVYGLFQGAMLLGAAIDSQEATFIREQLTLSPEAYGLLVSMTGIGSLAGASTAALLARRVPFLWYLGGGTFMTCVFYLLFYLSDGFWMPSAAFIGLGFGMAYAGAGYATYFQQQVPAQLMGRVASASDMAQGGLQIALTLLVGLLADRLGLQPVCVAVAALAAGLGLALFLRTSLFRRSMGAGGPSTLGM
ncbi:MFS transporter [Paenibacillus sp. FSL W8-1187]|uniref:Putative transporter n=1 Tax=Paenibacillus pasadenensis TaxID=217090 RepID=A0A2N5NCT8_9BACL|nr:MFS transporter [Paenibacillus pasadenensis]PLT48152.1 putative transporter [Paenibacillus pasadenensis]